MVASVCGADIMHVAPCATGDDMEKALVRVSAERGRDERCDAAERGRDGEGGTGETGAELP